MSVEQIFQLFWICWLQLYICAAAGARRGDPFWRGFLFME
jgi:hypothetical protein